MEQKEKKERKEKKRRREKCAKETVIFPRSSSSSSSFLLFSFFFLPSPPLLFSLPPLPRKRRRTYVTAVWRHISQRRRDTSHIVRIRLRCFSRLLDTSRKNTRASHASGKPLYNGSSWFLRLVKCARFEPIFPPSREKFVSRKPSGCTLAFRARVHTLISRSVEFREIGREKRRNEANQRRV